MEGRSSALIYEIMEGVSGIRGSRTKIGLSFVFFQGQYSYLFSMVLKTNFCHGCFTH